jgi:exonuclease III
MCYPISCTASSSKSFLTIPSVCCTLQSCSFAIVTLEWLPPSYTNGDFKLAPHVLFTGRGVVVVESTHVAILVHNCSDALSAYVVSSSFPNQSSCIIIIVVGIFIAECIVDCIRLLLSLAGDIHPNPGPGNTTTSYSVHVVDALRIINWKCRGIDNKLSQLPGFLKKHYIHVGVLTETRRSPASHRTQQTIHVEGYTFLFASYIDPSLSTNYLPPSARGWGVCIAIKDGLAYQRVEIDCQDFRARIVHGTLHIPANGDNIITIELIGAYAPANEAEKLNFWTPFTTYVLDCLKRTQKNQNHHLILIGDWNSYLDVECDTYRVDISTSPTVPATNYLQQLMDTIAQNNLLYDPIGREKLRAYDHYIYLSSNRKFRSILDKVFTSFSSEHCDKSIIVDWDDYKDITLSDHRAIITPISLVSLCQGWIKYPKTPFTMYPRINLSRRTTQQVDHLRSLVNDWKSKLLPHLAAHLLTDSLNSPINANEDLRIEEILLEEMHSALTHLFVDLPSKAFHSELCNRHRVYKTPARSWTCLTCSCMATSIQNCTKNPLQHEAQRCQESAQE